MELFPIATFLGFVLIFQLVLSAIFYILQTIRIRINRAYPLDYIVKYGKWAVVTGSTDGIGLAYTRELARRGLNVVLISRSYEKLKAVASDIELEFKVETLIIQADFSDGRSIYEGIESKIKNLDVGILVNNVGVGQPYLMPLEECTEKLLWDLVSVNALAGTMMMSMVLPGMKKRGRGAIVNVTSSSGLVPAPYMTVYGATKTYMEMLAKAVSFECRGSGVTIQTLFPGPVKTKMLAINPDAYNTTEYIVPTAETYAKQAILTLGVRNFTSGCWEHELQAWFVQDVAPKWFMNLYHNFLFVKCNPGYYNKATALKSQ